MANKIEIETRILISPALEKEEMDKITQKKVAKVSEKYGNPKTQDFVTIFFRKTTDLDYEHPVVRFRYYPEDNKLKTTVKTQLNATDTEIKFENEKEYEYTKDNVIKLIKQAKDSGFTYYAFLKTTRYIWHDGDTSIELSNHYPFSIQFELERILQITNTENAQKELETLKKQTKDFADSIGKEILTDEKYQKIWDAFWTNHLRKYTEPEEVLAVLG